MLTSVLEFHHLGERIEGFHCDNANIYVPSKGESVIVHAVKYTAESIETNYVRKPHEFSGNPEEFDLYIVHIIQLVLE